MCSEAQHVRAHVNMLAALAEDEGRFFPPATTAFCLRIFPLPIRSGTYGSCRVADENSRTRRRSHVRAEVFQRRLKGEAQSRMRSGEGVCGEHILEQLRTLQIYG